VAGISGTVFLHICDVCDETQVYIYSQYTEEKCVGHRVCWHIE